MNEEEEKEGGHFPPLRKKRKRCDYLYSIDVLTDGSEGTGGACLFLSLWGRGAATATTYHNENDDTVEAAWWQGTPSQARYALNLGSDTCSRIATDQRFKLAGNTKAVFCPNQNDSLWGWKAVHLALERAGAEKVTVVASHPRVERIVAGSARDNLCPLVQLCELSGLLDDNDNDTTNHKWWQVYEDGLVLVHATKVLAVTNDDDDDSSSSPSWAFLYTIYAPSTTTTTAASGDTKSHHHHDQAEGATSFLVLPPGSNVSLLLQKRRIHQVGVPLFANGKPIQCDFVVALNPMQNGDASTTSGTNTTVTNRYIIINNTSNNDIPLFVVAAKVGHDKNLLVRAREQSEAWHETCPLHFPWHGRSNQWLSAARRQQVNDDETIHYLETGTSLCWWDKDNGNGAATRPVFFRQDRTIHRKENGCDLVREPAQMSDHRGNSNGDADPSAVPLRSTWPQRLEQFLKPPPALDVANDDDNEIDLDDIEEEQDNSPCSTSESTSSLTTTPPCALELFCLGTGCAAPSAYRGASAYLLRGVNESHTQWNILLEAGEGVVTQLQRHVSTDVDYLTQISLIWISHAHWDHYGGLVPLLVAVRRARNRPGTTGVLPTPIMLAPRSVIRWCENMLCQQKQGEYFYGVAHEDKIALIQALDDWNSKCSAVAFWENVLVDHSCRNSYGCIFGIRVSGKRIFTFAFSGDTRPCDRFTRVCRRRSIDGSIDLLVHEATFTEEEKEMSIKKKHSTIKEAIQVGREVCAIKILLSHFSQRYSAMSDEIPTNLRGQVGIALDGMRLILIQHL